MKSHQSTMEYKYSDEVNRESYEDHGLAQNTPLRVHKDVALEVKGTLRAQQDWSLSVRPVIDYKGGLGDQYSFIQVTVPECLPERVETISYANEFAFLYDDEMENYIDNEWDLDRSNKMANSFGQGGSSSGSSTELNSDSVASRAIRLQQKVFAKMMAIDPLRAATSIEAWIKFLRLASNSRQTPGFTLAEYLPSRINDAGELIWFGTLTFGMGLTIPRDELDLCMKLAKPGYAAISLTNDLYSWKKEQKAAEQAGVSYVFNAIWVIMRERDVCAEDAMAVCAAEIRKYFGEYNQTVEEAKSNAALSRDTKAYLEAVRHSHVGNLVWSVYCPRYKL